MRLKTAPKTLIAQLSSKHKDDYVKHQVTAATDDALVTAFYLIAAKQMQAQINDWRFENITFADDVVESIRVRALAALTHAKVRELLAQPKGNALGYFYRLTSRTISREVGKLRRFTKTGKPRTPGSGSGGVLCHTELSGFEPHRNDLQLYLRKQLTPEWIIDVWETVDFGLCLKNKLNESELIEHVQMSANLDLAKAKLWINKYQELVGDFIDEKHARRRKRKAEAARRNPKL